MFKDIIDYVKANKEWLFSGIGITVIAGLFFAVKRIFHLEKNDIKELQTKIDCFIGQECIDVYKPRAEFEDYFSYVVSQAKQEVYAVSITFGFVSYVKLEKLIEESNIIFHFFVLEPTSDYFTKRRKDINKSSNDKDYLFISNIERIKQLQIKFSQRVFLHYYDSYPFWHYILIDEKKLFFSYHPIGNLGYKNANVFYADKSKSNKTFEVFYNHINIIKKESKKYEIES